MKIGIFLVIRHYIEGENGMEQCTLKRELKTNDHRKAAIIIDIMGQKVLKNISGYEDQDAMIDHYFKKYKDEIADAITDLLVRAEKYPYIAQQIEKYTAKET